jgi:DNA-directed RNA polymerase specialized sigma24 family protein
MQQGDSWLERLATGDVSAAEQLWQQFFGRLQAYAAARLRRLPPGLGDAEDVALSVFRSVCRMAEKQTIPSVRDPEHLWPLLATIAARKVARLVRKARPNQTGRQTCEIDLGAVGVDPDEVSILSNAIGREPSPELCGAIRDLWAELLGRLNTPHRIERKEPLIAELWLEGRTIREITQATGVPSRTVSRKLAMIRRLVQELGGELPEASKET